MDERAIKARILELAAQLAPVRRLDVLPDPREPIAPSVARAVADYHDDIAQHRTWTAGLLRALGHDELAAVLADDAERHHHEAELLTLIAATSPDPTTGELPASHSHRDSLRAGLCDAPTRCPRAWPLWIAEHEDIGGPWTFVREGYWWRSCGARDCAACGPRWAQECSEPAVAQARAEGQAWAVEVPEAAARKLTRAIRAAHARGESRWCFKVPSERPGWARVVTNVEPNVVHEAGTMRHYRADAGLTEPGMVEMAADLRQWCAGLADAEAGKGRRGRRPSYGGTLALRNRPPEPVKPRPKVTPIGVVTRAIPTVEAAAARITGAPMTTDRADASGLWRTALVETGAKQRRLRKAAGLVLWADVGGAELDDSARAMLERIRAEREAAEAVGAR